MMRLVNDDDTPEIAAQLRDQLATVHGVDRCKQVLVAVWRVPAIKQLAESRITQYLPKRRHSLLQDLGAMGDEQQARCSTFGVLQPKVIKGRHDRLACARRRHQQISSAAHSALSIQSIQHLLLVGLGPKVKPRLQGHRVGRGHNAATPLLRQGTYQGLAMLVIRRIVGLKFLIIPKGFEIRDSRVEHGGDAGLRELDGPLNAANQRGF